MQCFQLTLQPLSAFAGPIKGDTLFGQLCWAIRNRYGEAYLTDLLQHYTSRPFAIVSDGFPAGYLPLPKLPGYFYDSVNGLDRKAVKKRNWLAVQDIQQPLPQWLNLAKTDADIANSLGDKTQTRLIEQHQQMHNSINRQTDTTGENGFAPYSTWQYWYHTRMTLDCYVLVDEQQTDVEKIMNCLQNIGLFGYGRDASIGLGKFAINTHNAINLPQMQGANACLTLAPSAPQGLGYQSQHSYYQTFTRFGRHGDRAVQQQGKPFKNPILLAQTGAVLATDAAPSSTVGQAIGGDGSLSKTLPATVHQGYAPAIAIQIPKERKSI